MSAPWARDISPLVYTDFDDLSNSIVLNPGDTNKFCLQPKYQPAGGLGARLRPYNQVALASLGMAWDATGNNFLTWSLLIRGKQDDRYCNVKFSIAPPFGDAIYLPQPLWVPQLSEVDFSVSLGAGATGPVNFTGRIIPYYFLQDNNLQRMRDAAIQGPRNVGTH